MTVRVRVRQVAADQGNLTLKCVGTLTKCPYTAGARSRRGSPKAGTTVDGYPASLGFPIMHQVHAICTQSIIIIDIT